MDCGCQAVSVMDKFFLSNLHRHMVNKCWKFEDDILIVVWLNSLMTRNLLQLLVIVADIYQEEAYCCNKFLVIRPRYWRFEFFSQAKASTFTMSTDQATIKVYDWHIFWIICFYKIHTLQKFSPILQLIWNQQHPIMYLPT